MKIVTWTVRNIGRVTTSASSWYDSVYGAEVNDFSQAKLLGRALIRRYVEPNGQYDSQFKFLLNERSKATVYYVFVIVDRENYQNDFDPSNNQLSTPKMIQIKPIPLPNLEATRILVAEVGKAGEKFLIEWQVTNIGEGDVKENQKWTDTIEIYMVENLQFKLALRTDTSVIGKRLAPNEAYLMRAEIVLPSRLFGDANVQLIVNRQDTLYEASLLDNKISTFFQILPPDTPDLSLLKFELSHEPVLTGQELKVTYTVENEGSADLDGIAWNDEVRIVSPISQVVVSKVNRNLSNINNDIVFISLSLKCFYI